jgi:hypothetical protein
MSENQICLRLLGLPFAPKPGVTRRYIAEYRFLTLAERPADSAPMDPMFFSASFQALRQKGIHCRFSLLIIVSA